MIPPRIAKNVVKAPASPPKYAAKLISVNTSLSCSIFILDKKKYVPNSKCLSLN